MDINYKLGNRIRELRTNRGWSQEVLSFEAEINKNYISDLERGTRNPTVKIIARIAKAFQVEIGFLFSEEKENQIEKSEVI
ncbi:MAG: helix-turn-helix transcriptional regulator [Bacilli bacterium]